MKVSYLVLDFMKPQETQVCLESIKARSKFDYKVYLLVNGGDNFYASSFMSKGLVDHLIVNKTNSGLGVGTTDLFRYCDTPYALYVQNDQFLASEFREDRLHLLINLLNQSTSEGEIVGSISLAGAPCGRNIYSERAHLINVDFYNSLPTDKYGAGPYHDGPWNEELIQNYYKENGYIHATDFPIIFADNGRRAVRQNPDGSVWEHQPDTKRLWLKRGPVTEKHVYPKFTNEEWEEVLVNNNWPDGQIPVNEQSESFEAFNKL